MIPYQSVVVEAIPQNFVEMLKSYAVRWTTHPDRDITSYDEYTNAHRSHVTIIKDALYRHAKLSIRYTTYDMQTSEDTMYPKNNPGVMVASPEHGQPYLFARVLDVFHTEVTSDADNAMFPHNQRIRLEMVWVHWYQPIQQQGPLGFNCLQYPSISLCPSNRPDSYGLVHPDDIVRSVHLIPDFDSVPTPDDYRKVQVNMYVLSCSHMHALR